LTRRLCDGKLAAPIHSADERSRAMRDNPNPDTSTLPIVPTMAWVILALTSLDSILGMIDRQAISVLKATLRLELGIGDARFAVLVGIFLTTYAIFYPICGRLVDRFGSRASLTAFILIWSAATVMSGLANSYHELLVFRAVLGAAEAGLVPATIAALVVWFPRARVATAYSLRAVLVALGPIMAPPVIAWLALTYGWRYGFIVPGSVGILFALAWYAANRNPPDYGESEPAKQASDLSPMREVLGNKMLWGLIAARLISDPLWFFIQYWQAGYFQEVLGLTLGEVGWLLWIPPLAAALLAFPVGQASDRWVKSGMEPARARVRAMQLVALVGPLFAIIPLTTNIWAAMALFAVVQAAALVWLTLSNILAAALFPRRAVGTAVGVLNAVGTVGAALFNFAVGPAVETYGYTPVFVVGALLHPLAATILFLAYRRRGASGASPAPTRASAT
jgi:ACS family hexuronate transporter-like MFS transporter